MDDDAKKIPLFPAEMINGATIFHSEIQLQKYLQDAGPKAVVHQPDLGCEYSCETGAEIPVTYDQNYANKVYGNRINFICEFFNLMLADSRLAIGHLPLKVDNLVAKLSDGVLLCAMANALQPNTVDDSAVSSAKDAKTTFTLGLMSLHTLGVYMDAIETMWRGSQHSVLFPAGVLLQVMRLATVGRMNLKDSEHLACIYDIWEGSGVVEHVKSLSREDLLRRWVNYQLRRAGTDLQMKNFDTCLADGLVYAHLLNTVAPAEKRPSLVPVDRIIAVKDPVHRAAMIKSNAQALGIIDSCLDCEPTQIHTATSSNGSKFAALQAKQIVNTVNMAFLAQVCFKYPGIQNVPSKSTARPDLQEHGHDVQEALTMWLNSFGPSSRVVFLETDLRNGLTLLQVLEIMFPGCVNWSKVHLNLDGPNMHNFRCYSNCSEAIRCLTENGLKTKCTAQDIATGVRAKTIELLSEMMVHDAQLKRISFLGDNSRTIDDNRLISQWVIEELHSRGGQLPSRSTSQVSSTSQHQSPLLCTTVLGYIGERILTDACRLMEPDGASDGETKNWQFKLVEPVESSIEASRYSKNVTTMLRQGGISVCTSLLGSAVFPLVYKCLLLQLHALRM